VAPNGMKELCLISFLIGFFENFLCKFQAQLDLLGRSELSRTCNNADESLYLIIGQLR
jgi:hypothetical protein